MAKTTSIKFRRDREGKTDYKLRLKLLQSGKTRFAVRITNKNITIQAIKYQPKGDKVEVSASSTELIKQGWDKERKNSPAAYLTGILFAKKAQKKGISEGILDLGMQTNKQKGVIYAALKGMAEGGLKIPHSQEALPEEQRTTGSAWNKELPAKVNTVKAKLMVMKNE